MPGIRLLSDEERAKLSALGSQALASGDSQPGMRPGEATSVVYVDAEGNFVYEPDVEDVAPMEQQPAAVEQDNQPAAMSDDDVDPNAVLDDLERGAWAEDMADDMGPGGEQVAEEEFAEEEEEEGEVFSDDEGAIVDDGSVQAVPDGPLPPHLQRVAPQPVAPPQGGPRPDSDEESEEDMELQFEQSSDGQGGQGGPVRSSSDEESGPEDAPGAPPGGAPGAFEYQYSLRGDYGAVLDDDDPMADRSDRSRWLIEMINRQKKKDEEFEFSDLKKRRDAEPGVFRAMNDSQARQFLRNRIVRLHEMRESDKLRNGVMLSVEDPDFDMNAYGTGTGKTGADLLESAFKEATAIVKSAQGNQWEAVKGILSAGKGVAAVALVRRSVHYDDNWQLADDQFLNPVWWAYTDNQLEFPLWMKELRPSPMSEETLGEKMYMARGIGACMLNSYFLRMMFKKVNWAAWMVYVLSVFRNKQLDFIPAMMDDIIFGQKQDAGRKGGSLARDLRGNLIWRRSLEFKQRSSQPLFFPVRNEKGVPDLSGGTYTKGLYVLPSGEIVTGKTVPKNPVKHNVAIPVIVPTRPNSCHVEVKLWGRAMKNFLPEITASASYKTTPADEYKKQGQKDAKRFLDRARARNDLRLPALAEGAVSLPHRQLLDHRVDGFVNKSTMKTGVKISAPEGYVGYKLKSQGNALEAKCHVLEFDGGFGDSIMVQAELEQATSMLDKPPIEINVTGDDVLQVVIVFPLLTEKLQNEAREAIQDAFPTIDAEDLVFRLDPERSARKYDPDPDGNYMDYLHKNGRTMTLPWVGYNVSWLDRAAMPRMEGSTEGKPVLPATELVTGFDTSEHGAHFILTPDARKTHSRLNGLDQTYCPFPDLHVLMRACWEAGRTQKNRETTFPEEGSPPILQAAYRDIPAHKNNDPIDWGRVQAFVGHIMAHITEWNTKFEEYKAGGRPGLQGDPHFDFRKFPDNTTSKAYAEYSKLANEKLKELVDGIRNRTVAPKRSRAFCDYECPPRDTVPYDKVALLTTSELEKCSSARTNYDVEQAAAPALVRREWSISKLRPTDPLLMPAGHQAGMTDPKKDMLFGSGDLQPAINRQMFDAMYASHPYTVVLGIDHVGPGAIKPYTQPASFSKMPPWMWEQGGGQHGGGLGPSLKKFLREHHRFYYYSQGVVDYKTPEDGEMVCDGLLYRPLGVTAEAWRRIRGTKTTLGRETRNFEPDKRWFEDDAAPKLNRSGIKVVVRFDTKRTKGGEGFGGADSFAGLLSEEDPHAPASDGYAIGSRAETVARLKRRHNEELKQMLEAGGVTDAVLQTKLDEHAAALGPTCRARFVYDSITPRALQRIVRSVPETWIKPPHWWSTSKSTDLDVYEDLEFLPLNELREPKIGSSSERQFLLEEYERLRNDRAAGSVPIPDAMDTEEEEEDDDGMDMSGPEMPTFAASGHLLPGVEHTMRQEPIDESAPVVLTESSMPTGARDDTPGGKKQKQSAPAAQPKAPKASAKLAAKDATKRTKPGFLHRVKTVEYPPEKDTFEQKSSTVFTDPNLLLDEGRATRLAKKQQQGRLPKNAYWCTAYVTLFDWDDVEQARRQTDREFAQFMQENPDWYHHKDEYEFRDGVRISKKHWYCWRPSGSCLEVANPSEPAEPSAPDWYPVVTDDPKLQAEFPFLLTNDLPFKDRLGTRACYDGLFDPPLPEDSDGDTELLVAAREYNATMEFARRPRGRFWNSWMHDRAMWGSPGPGQCGRPANAPDLRELFKEQVKKFQADYDAWQEREKVAKKARDNDAEVARSTRHARLHSKIATWMEDLMERYVAYPRFEDLQNAAGEYPTGKDAAPVVWNAVLDERAPPVDIPFCISALSFVVFAHETVARIQTVQKSFLKLQKIREESQGIDLGEGMHHLRCLLDSDEDFGATAQRVNLGARNTLFVTRLFLRAVCCARVCARSYDDANFDPDLPEDDARNRELIHELYGSDAHVLNRMKLWAVPKVRYEGAVGITLMTRPVDTVPELLKRLLGAVSVEQTAQASRFPGHPDATDPFVYVSYKIRFDGQDAELAAVASIEQIQKVQEEREFGVVQTVEGVSGNLFVLRALVLKAIATIVNSIAELERRRTVEFDRMERAQRDEMLKMNDQHAQERRQDPGAEQQAERHQAQMMEMLARHAEQRASLRAELAQRQLAVDGDKERLKGLKQLDDALTVKTLPYGKRLTPEELQMPDESKPARLPEAWDSRFGLFVGLERLPSSSNTLVRLLPKNMYAGMRNSIAKPGTDANAFVKGAARHLEMVADRFLKELSDIPSSDFKEQLESSGGHMLGTFLRLAADALFKLRSAFTGYLYDAGLAHQKRVDGLDKGTTGEYHSLTRFSEVLERWQGLKEQERKREDLFFVSVDEVLIPNTISTSAHREDLIGLDRLENYFSASFRTTYVRGVTQGQKNAMRTKRRDIVRQLNDAGFKWRFHDGTSAREPMMASGEPDLQTSWGTVSTQILVDFDYTAWPVDGSLVKLVKTTDSKSISVGTRFAYLNRVGTVPMLEIWFDKSKLRSLSTKDLERKVAEALVVKPYSVREQTNKELYDFDRTHRFVNVQYDPVLPVLPGDDEDAYYDARRPEGLVDKILRNAKAGLAELKKVFKDAVKEGKARLAPLTFEDRFMQGPDRDAEGRRLPPIPRNALKKNAGLYGTRVYVYRNPDHQELFGNGEQWPVTIEGGYADRWFVAGKTDERRAATTREDSPRWQFQRKEVANLADFIAANGRSVVFLGASFTDLAIWAEAQATRNATQPLEVAGVRLTADHYVTRVRAALEPTRPFTGYNGDPHLKLFRDVTAPRAGDAPPPPGTPFPEAEQHRVNVVAQKLRAVMNTLASQMMTVLERGENAPINVWARIKTTMQDYRSMQTDIFDVAAQREYMQTLSVVGRLAEDSLLASNQKMYPDEIMGLPQSMEAEFERARAVMSVIEVASPFMEEAMLLKKFADKDFEKTDAEAARIVELLPAGMFPLDDEKKFKSLLQKSSLNTQIELQEDRIRSKEKSLMEMLQTTRKDQDQDRRREEDQRRIRALREKLEEIKRFKSRVLIQADLLGRGLLYPRPPANPAVVPSNEEHIESVPDTFERARTYLRIISFDLGPRNRERRGEEPWRMIPSDWIKKKQEDMVEYINPGETDPPSQNGQIDNIAQWNQLNNWYADQNGLYDERDKEQVRLDELALAKAAYMDMEMDTVRQIVASVLAVRQTQQWIDNFAGAGAAYMGAGRKGNRNEWYVELKKKNTPEEYEFYHERRFWLNGWWYFPFKPSTTSVGMPGLPATPTQILSKIGNFYDGDNQTDEATFTGGEEYGYKGAYVRYLYDMVRIPAAPYVEAPHGLSREAAHRRFRGEMGGVGDYPPLKKEDDLVPLSFTAFKEAVWTRKLVIPGPEFRHPTVYQLDEELKGAYPFLLERPAVDAMRSGPDDGHERGKTERLGDIDEGRAFLNRFKKREREKWMQLRMASATPTINEYMLMDEGAMNMAGRHQPTGADGRPLTENRIECSLTTTLRARLQPTFEARLIRDENFVFDGALRVIRSDSALRVPLMRDVREGTDKQTRHFLSNLVVQSGTPRPDTRPLKDYEKHILRAKILEREFLLLARTLPTEFVEKRNRGSVTPEERARNKKNDTPTKMAQYLQWLEHGTAGGPEHVPSPDRISDVRPYGPWTRYAGPRDVKPMLTVPPDPDGFFQNTTEIKVEIPRAPLLEETPYYYDPNIRTYSEAREMVEHAAYDGLQTQIDMSFVDSREDDLPDWALDRNPDGTRFYTSAAMERDQTGPRLERTRKIYESFRKYEFVELVHGAPADLRDELLQDPEARNQVPFPIGCTPYANRLHRDDVDLLVAASTTGRNQPLFERGLVDWRVARGEMKKQLDAIYTPLDPQESEASTGMGGDGDDDDEMWADFDHELNAEDEDGDDIWDDDEDA